MSEYKIELGIGLRDNDFNSIKDKIKSLENDDIKIKLNTSTVDTQIEKIEAKLKGLSNIKLDFGTDIKIDGDSAIKSAQQVGQEIGESVTKNVQKNLNFDDSIISNQVTNLMKNAGIAAKKGSKDFKVAFDEIKQAYVKTISGLGSVDDVIHAIAKNVKIVDAEKQEALRPLLNQIQSTRTDGSKILIPKEARDTFGKNAYNMRASLGNGFVFKNGSQDLENYITENLSGFIDMSKTTIDEAFGELVNKYYEAKNPYYSVDELFSSGNLNRNAMADEIVASFDIVRNGQNELVQSSNVATDTVVQNQQKQQEAIKASLEAKKAEIEQEKKRLAEINKSIDDYNNRFLEASTTGDPNAMEYYAKMQSLEADGESLKSHIDALDAAYNKEVQQAQEAANAVSQAEERKQQAYQETAKTISSIQKGSFQKVFDPADDDLGGMKNTAKSVEQYFKNLQGVISDTVSVKEQFDSDGNLDGFAVSLKNANGEAEKLRYTFQAAKDDSDAFFKYIGGSIDDSVVGKQTEKSIKIANDLQIELDKIKTDYSDTGATKPIKNANYIASLDEQYEKVKRAIIDVRNADSSTFTSMVSNVKKEKAALESMVKVYRNADNVSNSLKGTDFASGVKIRIEELGKFKAQATDFPQMTKTIEELDKAIEGVGNKSSLDSFTDQLKIARAELAKVKAETIAANRKEKVGIDVSGATSRIADIQRISPEIDEFKANINGAEVSVESLLNDLSKVSTAGDFSVVNRRLKAFEEAAQSAGIAVKETVTKVNSVNNIKIKISDTGFNGFEQEVKRVHAAVEELEGAYPDLEAALKRLDIAMNNVYSADQSGDIKRLVVANEEYESSLKQVYSQLKLYQQAEEKTYKNELLAQKKSALSSEMEIWLKDNTRATKEYGEEIRRLQSSLSGLDDKGVKLVGKQFKAITKQAQAMGKTGLTVFDKLKAKAKEYMAYLSAAELFMYAEQAFRSMFEAVKEIDTAMTGLYRVTDLTSAEYDALFNNMISSAKEYGATLNDIINATTDWVRAGFDANTALGLAEVTTMYQHISDLDYDTAAENLITAYNGFKDELNTAFSGDTVSAVNYIVDILNELDKRNCP